MAEMKPGSFVHIEFASSDPEKTRKFMEDVFDWEFQFMPEMEYHTYATPSGPGGGLMKPMADQQPGILNYLLSHDIDADVRKIEECGGRILAPKREIPGVGWWAVFQEPTGITMALFETKPEERPRPRPRARARKTTRGARKARGGRKARGRKK